VPLSRFTERGVIECISSESLPKWPWEALSFVAMDNAKLRIVIFQDGEWLCAHCLEYDLATQAKNLDDLRYDLERMIVGHIAVSLANGLKPFRRSCPDWCGKGSGAFFRWKKLTTNRPPARAATGGMRHGRGYQEVRAGA